MARKSKKNPEVIKLKKHFNNKFEEYEQECKIKELQIKEDTKKQTLEIVKKERKKERLQKIALFVLFVSIMVLLDIKDEGILLQLAQIMFGM